MTRSEHRNLDPGSIFIAEHYEGANNDRLDRRFDRVDGVTGDGITTCKSHDPIVIKDRKFIVLLVYMHQYVCIPLFTYNKDGAITRADGDDHVSVFDRRGPASKYIQQSQWKPLQAVDMTQESHRLAYNAAARITFPLSRAKNLPIEVLGHLDAESTERLKDLFIVLNGLAQTVSEEERLEARHRDPTWTRTPRRSTTDDNNPQPSPGTTPASFRPRSPEERSQDPLSKTREDNSPHLSGTKPSKRVDWTGLGQKRAEAAHTSHDSRGSDGRSRSDPPRRSSGQKDSWRALRRIGKAWWPRMEKANPGLPVIGNAGMKRKFRRGDEVYHRSGGQLRRSKRRRTKVQSYAE